MNVALNRLVLGFFLALVLCGALTGCKHTAHGAGEDIEKMGEKIQDKTN